MCVNTPCRVLSSAFLRTVCCSGDENMDSQCITSRGDRALSCFTTKSGQHRLNRNTPASFKVTVVLAKNKRSHKYLRLGRCWKASWSMYTRLLAFSILLQRKNETSAKYINILISKYLWLPRDAVVLYAEIFFLTAEDLLCFK